MKTFIITLFACLPFLLPAQSAEIDKLREEVLGTSGEVYVTKMTALAAAYIKVGQPKKAIKGTEAAIRIAKQLNDNVLLARALSVEGKAYKQAGDLSKAQKRLESSQRQLTIMDEKPLQFENAYILLQIAEQREKRKDITKFENQIAILKDKIKLNSADIASLKKLGIYGKLFPEALALEKAAKEKQSLAGRIENLEEAQVELSERSDALEEKSEELEEKSKSLETKKRQLQNIVRQKEEAIVQMTESQAKTELLVEQQKRVLDSLDFAREIDSLMLTIADKELKETQNVLKETEMESELQQSQRNFLIALAGIGILITIGMFLRYTNLKTHAKVLEEKNKIIEEEKKRSDELLLNILPKAVANELKAEGQAKVRHYKNVTVLFADFQNFSEISKKMTPEILIQELDFCFKNFDFITSNLQLEKIKTIGDAYMCAGGLPTPNDDHPIRVIRAALEMQKFLEEVKQEKIKKGVPYFEARIGIHSGPIIAGVVGLKKFAYDIWGDTVNVASRMESGSKPGRVNISGATYELVKDEFEVAYRGKVPAKNMGEVDMYFVEG